MKREPGKVTIKSQDADSAVIAGYGVVFGGEDLEGEHFSKDTDFMPDLVPDKPLFYEHTQDLPQHPLGKTLKEIPDEVGIWIEAQIDKSKAYAEAVLELIGEGVMGLSSGTAGHLARREGSFIRRWPIVEYSLTPQPAEPRTLGVSELKSLFDAAGLEMPETFNEAERQNVAQPERIAETKLEVKNMDEKEKETPPVDTNAIAAQVAATVKAQLEAEAEAKAEAEKSLAEMREEIREEIKAELKAEKVPAWLGGFSVPTETKPGDNDDGGLESFNYYLRTGHGAPYGGVMKDAAKKSVKFWQDEPSVKQILATGKAALQGQTDAEGGYLVPDDFWNNIVAKRDDLSVIRRVGANIFPTSLDRVLVPTEGTSMTKHAITAEEAAIDQEEPTFGQVIITVHKATKLVKASSELVADEAASLQPFLSGAFARAEAAWENYYFVSTGTGSGQPKAALVSSGSSGTLAGTNTITAAEVRSHMFGLDAPYAESPSAALVAARATVGVIAGLTGNPFSFSMMPAGDISAARGQFGNAIDGVPIYSDGTMPALATGAKVLLFGDWSYYMVADRMGSMIVRLNELYMGNDQVGFLHKFRRGGAAGQDEAFKHALTA